MRVRAGGMLALALIPLFAGCDPVPPPGTLIGKFHVLSSLIDNNCGPAAMPAVDPSAYDIEVRESGSKAYLRTGENAFQEGTITLAGDVYFSATASNTVIAPDAGIEGCILLQSEVITGHVERPLDAGVDGGELDAGVSTGAPFTASHAVQFTVSPGSNCGALLTVFGGTFDQLPCAAHFSLEGNY